MTNTFTHDTKKKILNELASFDVSISSEGELVKMEDLTKKFYPLQVHKFVFEHNKFLILGSKGSGKTALSSVLECKEYAKSLSKFLGVHSDSIQGTYWIKGLKKSEDFPTVDNFYGIGKEDDLSSYGNYWRLLALRSIYKQAEPSMLLLLPEDFQNVPRMTFDELGKLAQDMRLGEKLESFLGELDKHIQKQQKTLVIVYDALDFLLDKKFRGKMISALISMWYEYSSVFKNIRAKIFLRKDIFNSEVQDMTDKVKVNNYTVELMWTMDHLLAMVWKRAIEQSDELLQSLQRILEPLGMRIPKSDDTLLGYVPKADAKVNEIILNAIVGQRVGKGRGGLSCNWMRNRLVDTKGKILPRSVLKLFAEAFRKQRANLKHSHSSTLIDPKSIRAAICNASKDQIANWGEEYTQILQDLKKHLPYIPVNSEDLQEALRKCGIEAGKEQSSITQLEELGVIISTWNQKSKMNIYHMPDIYLAGLGIERVHIKMI